MQRLNRAVVSHGRTYLPGTARDAAPGVPDGPWWDGQSTPKITAKLDVPEPPRSGKGSGVTAWREYADQTGVTYSDSATRDDIIGLIDNR